ncbi:MAG TPA: hypothetical protein VE972_06180 [Conexibacter sp.]|nr:hypothetical protein [Conexibacter sp.]
MEVPGDPVASTPPVAGAMTAHARLLPGAVRLAALHAAALPQKEALCGAFWAALALQTAAAPDAAADPALDQEAVAVAAGTTIDRAANPSMHPPGAVPRLDYRLELPVNADEQRSGTAAAGLVRAIERLSDGALAVVPVRGAWSSARLIALIELVEAQPAPATIVANVATGPFWHSRVPFAQALRYLAEGDDEGPDSEWQVGHFVGVLGRVEGPRGTLVLVADTYRELGDDGVHRQPIERFVRALQRGDTGKGGLLLTVAADRAPALAAAVSATGLVVEVWDNGSDDVAEDADAR